MVPKIRHNGTQNNTPVVPRMSNINGTQIVPKMVPKWYPNSLTHFIRRSIFMIFQVQKMATSPLWVPFWVPSRIFGYHRLFFWKTYHVSYLTKNLRNISRYLLTQLHFYDFLPNPGFSFVGQIVFFGYHRIFYGTQKFYHLKV